MMERQTVLKNSEQEKWKLCVSSTCYAYRVVDRVKEVVDNIYEVLRQILNRLAEVFKPYIESLKSLKDKFIDFVDTHKDFIEYCSNYQQSYPPFVDNLKVDTKGFPRPITHCARSRC